jgi:hypothetical protein
MHHLPGPILTPLSKVVIHDLPWRQVMGQHAPGAAAAQEIENGVQDLTLRVRFRSAAWFGFGNQMFNQCPFFVTEVSRVGWSCIHSPHRTRLWPANATFWTHSKLAARPAIATPLAFVPARWAAALSNGNTWACLPPYANEVVKPAPSVPLSRILTYQIGLGHLCPFGTARTHALQTRHRTVSY